MYGVIGGTALAFAVAFGGSSLIGGIPTTSAQTTTPSTTPGAAPSTTPGAKPAPGQQGSGNAQSGTKPSGKGPRGGGPGRGGPGGMMGGPGGTISAISGNTITITHGNNITTTVTVSDTTTYNDAGKKIALSDLAVGERIDVRATKASDGTVTVSEINVVHDRLGGKVTAISGNTITVEAGGPGFGPGGKEGGPRGNGNNSGTTGTPGATPSTTTPATGTSAPVTTTRTITVDANTTFTKGGASGALSDIAVGDRINATGTLSTDKSNLTALQVNIELPHYGGKVTSVNGNSIVIDERGTSRTINVTADTKYMNGANAAALTDVKTGENINAEGSVDSSGVMTATTVQVGHPAGPGAGGPGGKGFGGPKGGGR